MVKSRGLQQPKRSKPFLCNQDHAKCTIWGRQTDRQTDLYTPTHRKWETEKDTYKGTLGSIFTPPLSRHSALPYFIKCVWDERASWSPAGISLLWCVPLLIEATFCLRWTNVWFAAKTRLVQYQCAHPELALHRAHLLPNHHSVCSETVINNMELNKLVLSELNGGGEVSKEYYGFTGHDTAVEYFVTLSVVTSSHY